MSYLVDNAIIMAAGFASRFAPISYEKPKGLIKVKGEILIERQIRQLQEAGIKEIIVVIGYKKEMFYYLKDKFNVILIENTEYETRNNHSSIHAAREYLKNSYVCSSDNYFVVNPFLKKEIYPFYSIVYYKYKTAGWCIKLNKENIIIDIDQNGGENSWALFDHIFFTKNFIKEFLKFLDAIYDLEETKSKLWERIYAENLDKFKLQAKKFDVENMYEFDTLPELREFDKTYNINSNCKIMQDISEQLDCKECEIVNIFPLRNNEGMQFEVAKIQYSYIYETKLLKILK